jgi:hypothetical protein
LGTLELAVFMIGELAGLTVESSDEFDFSSM